MVIDRAQPNWASTDSVSHSASSPPDAEVTDDRGFGKSLTVIFSWLPAGLGQLARQMSWMIRRSRVTDCERLLLAVSREFGAAWMSAGCVIISS